MNNLDDVVGITKSCLGLKVNHAIYGVDYNVTELGDGEGALVEKIVSDMRTGEYLTTYFMVLLDVDYATHISKDEYTTAMNKR